MNEIYWITRFDSINALILTIMIVSICVSAIVAIIYYCCNGQRIYDEAYRMDEAKECRGYMNTCKSVLKYLVPVALVFSILTVFVPTTKEALLIYGVGGTIDYIKQNPTARQLPSKCITALDKWVDSLGKEKSNSDKE